MLVSSILFLAFLSQLSPLFCIIASGKIIIENDSNHALTYSPSNAWLSGANCEICAESLDTAKLSGGNIHIAFYNTTDKSAVRQNVTFMFTGQKIPLKVFH